PGMRPHILRAELLSNLLAEEAKASPPRAETHNLPATLGGLTPGGAEYSVSRRGRRFAAVGGGAGRRGPAPADLRLHGPPVARLARGRTARVRALACEAGSDADHRCLRHVRRPEDPPQSLLPDLELPRRPVLQRRAARPDGVPARRDPLPRPGAR